MIAFWALLNKRFSNARKHFSPDEEAWECRVYCRMRDSSFPARLRQCKPSSLILVRIFKDTHTLEYSIDKLQSEHFRWCWKFSQFLQFSTSRRHWKSNRKRKCSWISEDMWRPRQQSRLIRKSVCIPHRIHITYGEHPQYIEHLQRHQPPFPSPPGQRRSQARTTRTWSHWQMLSQIRTNRHTRR